MSEPQPDSHAITDIIAERRRQIEAEGWTHEHDDQHDSGEMAFAAGVYAIGAHLAHAHQEGAFSHYWPWARNWWKPRTAREDMVRAGALIVAEIERLDRAAERAALWCVHVIGPDDLWAKPTKEAAEKDAADLNALLAKHNRPDDPNWPHDTRAEVIPWPGSAESHADSIKRQWKGNAL